MPKILIAIPTADKKIRKAATSLPNVKVLAKAQAEKYERLEWLVYTVEEKMTLKTVCALINSSTKRLRKIASKVQELTVTDTGRCTVKDV